MAAPNSQLHNQSFVCVDVTMDIHCILSLTASTRLCCISELYHNNIMAVVLVSSEQVIKPHSRPAVVKPEVFFFLIV